MPPPLEADTPADTSSFGDVKTEKTPWEQVLRPIRRAPRPSDAAARARDHQSDLRGPRRRVHFAEDIRRPDEAGVPDPSVPLDDPQEDAGYGAVRGRHRIRGDPWYQREDLRPAHAPHRYFGLEGGRQLHEWAAAPEQDRKFLIPGRQRSKQWPMKPTGAR